jgi:hypothetical protein
MMISEMIDTSEIPLQGTKVNIIVGSHVWAEDAETAWVDGEIVKINGEEAEIQATNGKKVTWIRISSALVDQLVQTFNLFLALSLILSLVIVLLHFLDRRKFVKTIPERYGGSCWWG